MTMYCHLCPEVVDAPTPGQALADTAHHVRLMHPDHWDGTMEIEDTTHG